MATIRILMPSGIVETMDMEEYVRGVVPVEMYTSWPMEALKAQAIAARTYAMWYVITNGGRGSWDCDTTTRYQAYVSWRNSRTTEAVDATAGIVGGTRDTALIRKTYFSARCGGHTLNSWGPSWLKSVPCPCSGSVLGHRQGMCQYGAKYLAERGYTCFQILDHYYDMAWYHEYLMLGEVDYDPTPSNPWYAGAPVEPAPPPEPEPPGGLEAFLLDLWTFLTSWFTTWMERSPKVLRDWWTKTKKVIDEWFIKTGTLVVAAYASIKQIAMDWYVYVKALVIDWFTRIMTLVQAVFSSILQVCVDWYVKIKAVAVDWYDRVKFVVLDYWNELLAFLTTYYGKVKTLCVDLWAPLYDLVHNLYVKVHHVIDDWWASVYWVVKGWIPNVYAIVSVWWANTKAVVWDWIDQVRVLVTDLWAEVHTFFSEWWGKVVFLVQEKYTQLVEALRDLYDKIRPIVTEWWESTKAVVHDWIAQLSTLAVEWWGRVVTFFTTWWERVHFLFQTGWLVLFALLTEPGATLWAWVLASLAIPQAALLTWLEENIPTQESVDASLEGVDDWVGEMDDYLERLFHPETGEEKAQEERMKQGQKWVMDDTLPDHRPELVDEALPLLPMIVKE